MPEYRIHNLFPTVVYEDHIPVKDEWLKKAKQINYERMPIGNGDFTNDKFILKQPEFVDLEKSIIECAGRYVFDYMKSKRNINIEVLNSWINVHHPGDWAQPHIHGNSILSGVYYLDHPENSGDISFDRPLTGSTPFQSIIYLDYTEPTDYNCENYNFAVTPGKILLFPSYLAHSVEKNKSQEKRYSLAFNLYFRGKIGEDITKVTL